MDKFVRLSEDALHQRHAPDCAGFKLGQKQCDCLVSVVISLQAELDGRFGWRFSQDPMFRDVVTVLTPGRKKLRISTYSDGRLRFRVLQGAPMALLDAHLGGAGADVLMTLIPENWSRPPEMVRTDYIIGYAELPGGPALYFPRRFRPDLPIRQQWETTRKRARHFSTSAGASQVIAELATQVPIATLSVMPVQVNTNIGKEGE